MTRITIVLFLLCLLAACGGGGEDEPATEPVAERDAGLHPVPSRERAL